MSRRLSSKVPLVAPPLLAIVLAGSACDTDSVHDDREKIELRYTEYGIPHLRAASYENLGYAQGYAQARDNLCEIERSMLVFNGQLSRYFGPDLPPTRM